MKNINIWKVTRYLCIMGILGIILYLVVLYKVTWQNRDFNTYLYFYDCNGVVCNSTTKPSGTEYTRIICENDVCPYALDFMGDLVVLSKDDVSWLFNYKTGTDFNREYVKYEKFKDEYFIVTDSLSMQESIMNIEGNIVTKNKYAEIIEYNHGLIVHKKNNKIGIDHVTGEKVISPKYENVVLINNTLYAGVTKGKYQIYGVVNNAPKNNVKYDYLWSMNDVILVVKDKQLDILDNKLDSTLLMKIPTSLSYTTEVERNLLNINFVDSVLQFNINVNNDEFVTYKYDILEQKLLEDE